MSTDTIDYAAIIADLEAKKAAIENAIASFRAVLGALGQSGDMAQDAIRSGAPIRLNDLPAGFALGKSIPESAKLYLTMVKQKQTSAQIAEALIKGGLETTSKNFTQILHSGLDRARRAPGAAIIKLGKSHWGLAEWYPTGVRNTVAAQPSKKAKKKTRKTATAVTPKEEPATAEKPKPEASIIALLSKDTRAEFTAKQLSDETGLSIQAVHLILGKLVNTQRAQKTESGMYRFMFTPRQITAVAS